MRRKILHQTLGRLCQSEASPQVESQCSDDQRREEAFVDADGALAGFEERRSQRGEEDGEGEDLEGKAREEDVVVWCWVLLV